MEEKNTFKDFIKKQASTEVVFRKIPVLLLLICILLVIAIFMINKTNQLLETVIENGISVNDYESFKDTFIEVETEDNKNVEDYLPIVGEMHEKNESTTKDNSSNVQETTTKQNLVSEKDTTNISSTTETTTQSNNNTQRKTYVLNVSSKKIHEPTCSFVPRTKEENKKTIKLSDDELNQYKNDGYTLCKTCGGK